MKQEALRAACGPERARAAGRRKFIVPFSGEAPGEPFRGEGDGDMLSDGAGVGMEPAKSSLHFGSLQNQSVSRYADRTQPAAVLIRTAQTLSESCDV